MDRRSTLRAPLGLLALAGACHHDGPDRDGSPDPFVSVWDGDLGEADIADFCERGEARTVTGSVLLYGTSLTDLSGLSCLTDVGGDVIIEGNQALVSLDGLEGLETVGGDLAIGTIHCDDPVQIDQCTYRGNPALTSVGNLGNLASVGGRLWIAGSPELASIQDFDNLALVGSDGSVTVSGLWFAGIPSLDALPAFPSLTSLRGALAVWRNPSLGSLHGLETLNAVGDLLVVDNDALPSLDGLDGLTQVGGFLLIDGNAALTSLAGLDGVTDPGPGALSFRHNPSLASIDALAQLGSLGYLQVTDNDALSSLTGLEGVSGAAGMVWLDGNASLASITALGGVDSLGWALHVADNDALTSLDGLDAVNSVGGTLYLSDNDALTDLDGLGALASVGGDLFVGDPSPGSGQAGNAILASTTGLGNLVTIGGALVVGGNPLLETLDGLGAVGTVSGDLVVERDAALDDVTALHGLDTVGGNAWIVDDPLLDEDEVDALLAAVDVGGSVYRERDPRDQEALSGVAGVVTSEHFALKWGSDWVHDSAWETAALETLEQTWATQMGDMGLAEPEGMNVARFNVYVAETGVAMGGLPLGDYVSPGAVSLLFDPDGLPMIAMRASWWDWDAAALEAGEPWGGEVIAATLPHEFWHASQAAAGSYHVPGQFWWSEGMAEWMGARQVEHAFLAGGYGWPVLHATPELPLEFDDVWSVATTDEEAGFLFSRFYTTAVLPWMLSEERGRLDLVVAWAADPATFSRPMDALAARLKAEGEAIGETMTSLWAGIQSGRFWDAEEIAWAEANTVVPEGLDHNPTLTATAQVGEVAPPRDRLPGRFGANVLRIDGPPDEVVFGLVPEPEGSAFTPVRWGVAVVRCMVDACTDEVLAAEVEGETVWTLASEGADRMDIVLVPIADRFIEGETFAWKARLGD